ncbi:hypothetical protein EJ04DRAFT_566873 [Polyplosphaeria fusca]|uniref:Rhodopsin domain-containing protein n=1 Tax=Polyplosphaeria fusca TaxID=682080 RepID=A0A9P4QU84_9PLEO|nr:hypothetical protein EJ04DRAFT_566873 [Polyplosphaeria fusca]
MAHSAPATPIILSTIFPALAILAVIGRFYARRLQKHKIQLDDWMALAALIACVGNASILVVAPTWTKITENLQYNEDKRPIPTEDLARFQRCIYANQIVGHASVVLSRAAILLLYTRVFFVHRSITIIIYILHALNLIWGIFFSVLYTVQCWPLSEIGKKPLGTRKCDSHQGLLVWFACSMVSTVLDIAILGLPLPCIVKLHLPKREKAAVLGIFMLGGLVIVANCGKTWNIWQAFREMRGVEHSLYYESTLMFWIVPETCLAVICACIPTLRPILSKLSRKMASSMSHSSTSHCASDDLELGKSHDAEKHDNVIVRTITQEINFLSASVDNLERNIRCASITAHQEHPKT